jgi:hypothetical protein
MSIDGERKLILFGLRMRTEAYRDAFEALGYEVAADVVRPTPEQLSRAALCIISLYDGVRRPWETLRLKRSLARARIPLIGLDRDAPWHLGVRVLRLASFAWLKVLDILRDALRCSRHTTSRVSSVTSRTQSGRAISTCTAARSRKCAIRRSTAGT